METINDIKWQVYIIVCSDQSLYTGITIDINRRFSQHASGKGAKYFRGRAPLKLAYLEEYLDRSSATKRELQIKKLSLAEKWRLIASAANQLQKDPQKTGYGELPVQEKHP